MMGNAFAFAALILSGCMLLATLVALRRKASSDDLEEQKRRWADKVIELERKNEELKGEQILQARELQECREARAEVGQQNTLLLIKMVSLQEELAKMKERRDGRGTSRT